MSQPTLQKLEIIYFDPKLLKPDPKNPRMHSKRQLEMIGKSIAAHGFTNPVLIDSNSQIIAGHGRVLAATMLGLSEIPAVYLHHLSSAQIAAYQIADNRLCELSTWDDALLAEQLQILAASNLDFSLEVTGFTMGEIDLRIEGAASVGTNHDPIDTVPQVESVPVTQTGDVWLLGRHRMYCGNALEERSFQRLMNGAVAAMVFVDPPYNVPVDGHVSGLGAIKHREFAMAVGEMGHCSI